MGRSLIPLAPFSEKTMAVGAAEALAGICGAAVCAIAVDALMAIANMTIRFIFYSPRPVARNATPGHCPAAAVKC